MWCVTHLYNDGSLGEGAVLGSGIFIKEGNGIRICKRNLNYCSVFWPELLAIEVLKFCIIESVNTDIWILSDSRSSIQHLFEWWRHGDRTTSILQLLSCLRATVKIFFQWVLSHVNVCGNEIADGLVREGMESTYGGCFTFSEIVSWVKQITSSWRQDPIHERYEGNCPGVALLWTSRRRDGTILARFRSGHTRAQ
ncbi:uncharacterized protein TNCV_4230591 [Trichonephila clavipes]|uniref:RNase H type-1 domain-containing protein n=1 Tax=Trichonephila clavipes TaxID=2585209 RepID=A0A8X6SHM4_TRICX|nr:uncharacterized protein TNCV_4230591 [Trichonephila clavipes]